MKIDLSPIISGEKKELPFSFTENAGGGDLDIYFKGLDVVHDGDMTVSGTITDISGFCRLECSVTLPYVTHCSRCGRAMRDECRVIMERIASVDPERAEDDGYILYSDRQLELDGPVYEELSISFPSKPLCKADCRGLCPVCGQDLNENDCEHSVSNEENDTL